MGTQIEKSIFKIW